MSIKIYIKTLFKKIRLLTNKGQSTIEYLLVMTSAATFVVIITVAFHRKLLGAFFTVFGLILGVKE